MRRLAEFTVLQHCHENIQNGFTLLTKWDLFVMLDTCDGEDVGVGGESPLVMMVMTVASLDVFSGSHTRILFRGFNCNLCFNMDGMCFVVLTPASSLCYNCYMSPSLP